MQINRTLSAQKNTFAQKKQTSTPQQDSRESSFLDKFTKEDLYTGGAGLAGGLALGAGGAYLGLTKGMEFGLNSLGMGQSPVHTAVGLLVAIPVAVAYGAVGAAIGGGVGAVTGAAAGVGIRELLK